MNKYNNSLLHKRNIFNTSIEYITTEGDNFYKVLIFIGTSEIEENLIGSYNNGDLIEVNFANYVQYTTGQLKKWLDCYFAEQTRYIAYINVFTDYESGNYVTTYLENEYNKNKNIAYWKTILTSQTSLMVALSNLHKNDTVKDKKLTRVFFSTDDNKVLNKNSTESIAYLLNQAESDAILVYHSNPEINLFLLQLSRTFKNINISGTPIGNKLQLLKLQNVTSSKSTDENFTANEYDDLEAQNIGYLTYITAKKEDGLALEFGKDKTCVTLKGTNVCAIWTVDYINYLSEIKAIKKFTGDDVFLNEKTYKEILSMLSDLINPFVTIGRLKNVTITKAPFKYEINVQGKTLIIPNAWSAYWVDEVGGCEVSSTLYITL